MASAWNELAVERKQQGYGFAALATEDTDLEGFVSRHGFDFPVLTTKEVETTELPPLYTPSSIVFDVSGEIVAMGAAGSALVAKGSDFFRLSRAWPEGLAESFYTSVGEVVLARSVTRSEVEVDGIASPVHVFETKDRIAGFGVHINCEQPSAYFSDIESLMVLDDAGRMQGVIPLRRSYLPTGTIGRDQLEQWATDRQPLTSLSEASRPERDFKRAVRASRIALGFSAMEPK